MQITRFTRIIVLILSMCGYSQVWAQASRPRRLDLKSDVAIVPFVGCGSDGQLGPKKPPSGQSRSVAIPAEAAQSLAYYKGEIGVVAPRGWHCFGTYGSSGATLYVSPEPINAAEVMATSWKGFAGSVVQVSHEYGGTSGRFGVARTIARIFPANKAFVDRVVAEGIEPASSFPSGPYPADTLKYRSENIVEFLTPPQKEGLGTDSRLQKSDSPIIGVAILVGDEPDLLRLWVRLASDPSNLAQWIIRQTERDANRLDKW